MEIYPTYNISDSIVDLLHKETSGISVKYVFSWEAIYLNPRPTTQPLSKELIANMATCSVHHTLLCGAPLYPDWVIERLQHILDRGKQVQILFESTNYGY